MLPGIFGVPLLRVAFLVPTKLLVAHAHKVMLPFLVEVRLYFVVG